MASDRTRVKQETTRTRMELTKVGARGKTNNSRALARASSSYQGKKHMKMARQENTEHTSHEYEDVVQSSSSASPSLNIPYKNNNAVHPKQTSDVELQAYRNQNKSIECWRHSNKDSLTRIKMTLGIVLVVSLISSFLVVLDVIGVIGPQCDCNGNSENKKQYKENIQPNVSTSLLLKKIDMLEKNMSSVVRQLKSKYGGNGCNGSNGGNNSNGSNEGNGGICGNVGKKENSSSSITITTEVKHLREKQVQLDSSLTKLKESDKAKASDIQDMSTKVNGLAVAVKFLSANDSLIKSKVHKLSQAEVEFRSSLEELKQKDVEVHTSLKRAKGVEAFLNSSVSQLKSTDGLIKNKVDQLNSTFMTKIHSINSTVNTMQGGGAGPPGPPGTPGAGNLSQCQHQQEKYEGTGGQTADFVVNFVEPKEQIVVGASCSTVRGDEASLSSVSNSQGQKVYLCRCRGQSNFVGGSGNMKCLIDVWVCPRIF